MARSKSAVQADRCRPGVGHHSASSQYGCLHYFLRAARQAAFGRAALSGFLFSRSATMVVLRHGSAERHQRRRRKPAGHYESVLPAHTSSGIVGSRRFGGFLYRLCGSVRDDAEIRHRSRGTRAVSAAVPTAGGGDSTRSGVVAFGVECAVPRCALRNWISGAILDAGIAGGVSQQSRAEPVALAVRSEPHGWGDRGIPLGSDRPWAAPWSVATGVGGDGDFVAGEWIDLLSTDGRDCGGRGVAEFHSGKFLAPMFCKSGKQRIYRIKRADRIKRRGHPVSVQVLLAEG